jgi:multifunctional methyltransferase subunit TRM112|eukprot:gene6148-4413_t
MRLLTHNSLKCPVKGVAKGYPLQLTIVDMEVDETEVKPDFIRGILPSLEWEGVLVAAAAVGFDGLPESWDTSLLDDRDFILAMHRLLIDIHIVEGVLTCPETGRTFPIKGGIVDMVLPESDV